MMGAGKSSVGRRLATRLGVGFVDADQAIEEAAGCSIADYFSRFGEEEFRRGERRVIARLMEGAPRIDATGGGACMADETREAIRLNGISVWLKAELDVLFDRVSRRVDRPLLRTENPRETLRGLMELRYPVYAQADITVESRRGPIVATVDRVYQAVVDHLRPGADDRQDGGIDDADQNAREQQHV